MLKLILSSVLLFSATFACAQTREWTVMAYVNGRNNLESNALKDLHELELGYHKQDKVSIVVELARSADFAKREGNWSGVRRFEVLGNLNPFALRMNDMKILSPDTDMGSPEELVAFIRWAKTRYPAKRYLLVMWGHGISNIGLSTDNLTGHYITLPALKSALISTGGVDVLFADACAMQTVEFVYEMRGAAKYVVGSQLDTPKTGFPYYSLARLVHAPQMTARKLSAVIAGDYVKRYMLSSKPVIISAADVSRAGQLSGLMRANMRAVPRQLKRKFLLDFFWQTGDFSKGIKKFEYFDRALAANDKRMDSIVRGQLIFFKAANHKELGGLSGLGMGLPRTMDFMLRYLQLDFHTDSGARFR